ncbi:hypothetical protein K402DRAFT_461904 [Aulographum hederae CBS 113979]|uniref:MFS general substrate transporter n=1 Tax=Aulographum hederae CBS 113979 TaxID=1176131 RepID=A0A6G1H5J7_9PEZI|nr:hypothetical protein K402DRAFT_461904 [Aulographum hederae CBS 113979]
MIFSTSLFVASALLISTGTAAPAGNSTETATLEKRGGLFHPMQLWEHTKYRGYSAWVPGNKDRCFNVGKDLEGKISAAKVVSGQFCYLALQWDCKGPKIQVSDWNAPDFNNFNGANINDKVKSWACNDGKDPSIRPIGSTPSLRQTPTPEKPRAPSSLISDDGRPTHFRDDHSPASSPSSIDDAIAGLEGLMQEAVMLAHRNSVVNDRHRPSVAGPLHAEELEVESSSGDYSSSGSSGDDTSTESSANLVNHGTFQGRTPTVHHAATAHEPANPYDPRSVQETPPQFYQDPPSMLSNSRDFAYDGRRGSPNSPPSPGQVVPPAPLRRKTTFNEPNYTPPAPPVTETNLRRRSSVKQQPLQNPWIPDRRNTAYDPMDDPGRKKLRTLDDLDVGRNPNPNHQEQGRSRRHRSRRHRRPRSHQSFDEKPTFGNLDPNTRGLSIKRKKHFSLRDHHNFSFGHHHRRQPIARKWSTLRKRWTATIACINTGLIGFIVGVYAGEVPKIQYQLVDTKHYIIQGNIYLYIGLAISTFFLWPLPLLHGRKPYTLMSLALVLPLQFPQAVVVSSYHDPSDARYRVGLLISRFFTGLTLGFANVNFFTTLLDLFGASLQSSNPHQELVLYDDVRRQGGGLGMWLGIWSWSFVASIAVGFVTGAGVIHDMNPAWGFYIVVIVTAVVLLLNVIAPEPRRSAYRRSLTHHVEQGEAGDERVTRRVARGEVKLHLSSDGPYWWGEEVWAGVVLSFKMIFQAGFFVLASYIGWIYAQVVLVIVLLGALLSRNYRWRPNEVGAGVMAIAVGALIAVPLAKANIFSRDRKKGPRTDSMTFEEKVTWTSHMLRRLIFMFVLPFAGLAYTLASPGINVHYMVPIIFAGLIGFLSNLALAECHGLIMETFDTSDLQPGANSKHRLQSLAPTVARRRTNYSSFPRVTAGVFVSQTIAFALAAAATGVGGSMTRNLGAQRATAVTAGLLLGITILLTAVLWRFRSVQVIPNYAFGTRRNTEAGNEGQNLWKDVEDEYWKPVIIGNPSGKVRRMSVLELGKMSRWTEIRKLNKLIRDE